MEATLNTYAVAPLIDWNFKTQAYPEIRFEKLADASIAFLRDVFNQIMKAGHELPDGFINEVVTETAKTLKLKWAVENKEDDLNKKAYLAFERGKKLKADKLEIDAPKTPRKLKEQILKLKIQPDLDSKCFKLGEKFTNVIYKKQKNMS